MRPPVDCFIGLGSNLGDRKAHLAFALKALSRLPFTRLVRRSRLHETAAVGPPQPKYLNAVAWIKTRLSPMGLLVELKRLEALRGRRAGPRWGPRPLDCDILYYGKKRLKTPWLTLPHPLALSRRFVLEPLAELRSKMLD
ncbi:MAG: 2-amino-4-hydroxy-6-hydroxymethyldihydropteridine diphosphokinase [Elusimicrobia bacterium]|nr:2-amino-4-hydroxy-6-hydroxymethyldihydropteridine diphosphokinase [Elusimicrobiota bacterium]